MNDDTERRGRGRELFQALVVAGGPSGGEGHYECEAVDVSARGMRLQTAYLPQVGDMLTLRFDTASGEITAKGKVVWCKEEGKGGEFGIEFCQLDDAAKTALAELCGFNGQGEIETAREPSLPLHAIKGARVRLHIDGLGSPMRARVRDAESDAIMVGSNLEFLRVGRPLELEDLEGGKKRAAFIDEVTVEVDKETNVPQLVVTLRYEGKDGKPERRTLPGIGVTPKEIAAAKAKLEGKIGSEDEAAASDEPQGPPAMAAIREKATELFSKVGPAFGNLGSKAKVAFGAALTKARAVKGESAPGSADEKPLRRTAPPPDGALKASGKRVVRDDGEEQAMDEEMDMPSEGEPSSDKKNRLRVLAVAGAGLVAIVIALVALRGGKSEAPPGAEAAASADAANPALPAATVAMGTRPALPPGTDAVTANVPLFGTTTLSTTEPAPLPAPTGAVAGLAPLGGSPTIGGPAPTEVKETADAGNDDEKGDATYGKGTVKKPRLVKLKMDAPFDSLKGSVSGTALTLTIPGRHNVEPATTLAKRDKRISSVKAVPNGDGVDVTFTFKDSVPPFMAKADGKMLELAIGEPSKHDDDDADDEPTASAKKHHGKKHGAVAQKDGKKHGKDGKKSKKTDGHKKPKK